MIHSNDINNNIKSMSQGKRRSKGGAKTVRKYHFKINII